MVSEIVQKKVLKLVYLLPFAPGRRFFAFPAREAMLK